VPDRIEEGYGPNAQAFETSQGTGRPIWSSRWIAARRPLPRIEAAAAMDLTVVVIDHHLMDGEYAARGAGQSQSARTTPLAAAIWPRRG
jgi:single-stranded DNA-specific DHH superfamily exonuclease